MPDRFAELAQVPPTELEALLRSGLPIDTDTLEGLWHGYSLAMPAPLFKLFGHFGKTFVREPSGRMRGWNVRMRQGAGWTPMTFRGKPVTYGHYEVVDEPQDALADQYPNAFLIDYGKGRNRAWDPLGRVRDWVVQVDDGVLLGRMYLALGGRQVPTPSYFALARAADVAELVSPPA